MQSISRSILPWSSTYSMSCSWHSRCLTKIGQWNALPERCLPPVMKSFVPKRTKKTVAEPCPENACKANAAFYQKGTGKIYDKKPFKFTCIEGKSYLWCTCGWSKTQPFCDSTHKNPHFKIKLRPIRFIPRETKEYTFCNCKQSSTRPLCDGTHKREDIQAAVKS